MILHSLIELFLETGKPVASQALKDFSIKGLSAATLRNYFTKLEESGYLKQPHSSGGRIPTPLAYQWYAEQHLLEEPVQTDMLRELRRKLSKETREIGKYLEQVVEITSEVTQCAVVLSAPRCDQDFLFDIKLVKIDEGRILAILITDFGLLHYEPLYADEELKAASLRKIEEYFRARLLGGSRPELSEKEEKLASRFYGELMLRHLVASAAGEGDSLYRTGFSRLLLYPDFSDVTALASGLALFEDREMLTGLLRTCMRGGAVSCAIGGELGACAVIAAPYQIHQTTSGAIALLGPMRMPYRTLFAILKTVQEAVSETLTKSMYKFKIPFRSPEILQLHESERLRLENRHE
jgi:heat-inducible transcriptional repressor